MKKEDDVYPTTLDGSTGDRVTWFRVGLMCGGAD
jgi:hypothetical protein